MNESQLRRLLVEHLTKQKLGLTWEASAIERDAALNADLVLPRRCDELSLGGEFAYLRLNKVEAANAPVEADAAHVFQLIALRRFGEARPLPPGPVKPVGQSGDCAVLVCERVDAETISCLAAWPQDHGANRLAVYSPRPSWREPPMNGQGKPAMVINRDDPGISPHRGEIRRTTASRPPLY